MICDVFTEEHVDIVVSPFCPRPNINGSCDLTFLSLVPFSIGL